MNRQKCMSRWRGDRMSIKRSTEKSVPFLFRVLMVYRVRLFCGFFRNRIFLFSEFTRSYFMTGVDIHNHTEKRFTSKILWAVFISPRLAPIYFLIFFLELFGLVVERYPNQKLFFFIPFTNIIGRDFFVTLLKFLWNIIVFCTTIFTKIDFWFSIRNK